MTITKLLDKLYKMDASEGMVFASLDKTKVYNNIMYIPNPSTAECYIEVTEEEGEEIKKKEKENAHDNL